MYWKLNQSNTACYICDKHRHTMIFIDMDGENDDLIEIKDNQDV